MNTIPHPKQKYTPPKREKKCRRCGCTEDHACAGGCSWVEKSDVCDECLTHAENNFYCDLMENQSFAANQLANAKAALKRSQKQLRNFGKLLSQRSQRSPLIK